jgi:hypothetical protein
MLYDMPQSRVRTLQKSLLTTIRCTHFSTSLVKAGPVAYRWAGIPICGYSKTIRQPWLLGQRNKIKNKGGIGLPGELAQTQEACSAVPAGRAAFLTHLTHQYGQGWDPILALPKGVSALLGIVP